MPARKDSPTPADPRQVCLSLAIEGVGEGEDWRPPAEFRILANGVTNTLKGPVVYNAESGEVVMERLRQLGRDSLPFDYGHGMICDTQSYDTACAAGWFKLEMRDDGLWASDIQWTSKAAKALEEREFRYFSPFLYLDIETAEIRELVNVALTNLPATMNQTPLVASATTDPEPNEDDSHMDLKQLLEALGVQNASQAAVKFSTLQSDVTKLTEGAQASQARLTELEAENAKLKEGAELASKEQLVASLTADGKLSPAQKDWALSLSVDALKGFAASAPVVAPSTGVQAANPDASTEALTAEDRAVMKLCGIPEAEYVANKRAANEGPIHMSWADQARAQKGSK